MKVCTTITRSYLARARVLARSLARIHPEQRLAVLIVDAMDEDDREDFDVLRPADLAPWLSADEFARMSVIYESKELSTSLKPWFLTRLLADGAACVLFLDPDCEIFAPLDHLAELTRRSAITLTPHSLTPIPLDGLSPTDNHVERTGVYNTGYLGVSRAAAPFLEWLAARLRRYCLLAPEKGLYVDQRWANFVPVYFEHALVRDTTCNVAYWNLHERRFTRSGERYLVDGRPLTFFHFSGFDSERPALLSRHGNRIQLSEHPDLQRFCAEHAERLLAAGYRESKGLPYAMGAAADLPRRRRRQYRAALQAAEWRDDAYRLGPAESTTPPAVRRPGALGGRTQALVSKLVHPYRVHQEKTMRAVLDAMRERNTAPLDDPGTT